MSAPPADLPLVFNLKTADAPMSRAVGAALCIALVMVIGWLDYVTGDFSMAVFYLVPVCLATWLTGRAIGFFIAALSGVANLISELGLGHLGENALIPFWNAGVLAAMYSTTVFLLSTLRRWQLDLERRIEERTASLVRANAALEVANQNLTETKALAERHEKLASLGVLAAGVAHEIRNPLTAIKTRIFTLKRRLDQDTAAAGDTMIIESEVLRLERIVYDFLLFARPGEPRFAPVSSNELFDRVRELLGPELAESEIELLVDEDSARAQFPADAQQLQQVLINLVRNAAESIVRSGRITLCTRLAQRQFHGQSQEVVVIEVQDTGAGIPAAVRARLFDPFFTTKPAGTGLGLSIALRILEKHGGSVEVRGEPGLGTTFSLILPTRGMRPTGA